MSRKRLGCRDLHETYLIDRFAGQGTYGAVHIGRDKETGAMVAIKHLKLARDEIDCFPLTNLREIKALRSLGNFRHQNIVNFIEVVTTKPSDDNRQLGDVYMVFDAAEGDLEGLLDDWHEGIPAPGCETGGGGDGGGGTSTRPSNAAPRRTPLPISLIRHLMHQLLSGLAFIHSHGYVHRDIKPANLLLNCDYSLRIADFGLVKKCTPGQKLTPGMCTPWWRAPEVLLSDSFTGPPMGPPMDVWSAGVVFTNMLFRSTRNSFHSHQQAIPALHSIWRICGAPDEKSWPGIRKFGVFLTALPSGNPPRDIYRKYGRLLVLNMIIDECSIPGDVGIFLVWGVLFAPQK